MVFTHDLEIDTPNINLTADIAFKTVTSEGGIKILNQPELATSCHSKLDKLMKAIREFHDVTGGIVSIEIRSK